ncbi:MAG: filamentous hemagglutinin N-terminal domain-containing protein [Dolichospermum sp. WA123]|nr:filamentous hemagglutinin N-terminal domain-containing protein [Dolichospermum sp. WA123]
MTKKYKLNKSLQLGLAGLLGWLIVSVFTTKTQAQQSNIVPDNTLGAESSQVIGNFQKLPIEVITGGATRQINLFHSFKEFNISEGRAAYFFSPSGDIQNILARVTGTNPSGIFGKLGTVGNSSPNLFLINPNGIVFGKNASLDVQGSFVGTTANGVQFGNQGIFSATNPQAAPLLTINPSVLLFNQIQANGGIINQSQAPAGMNPIGEDVAGLRVADSKSLLLVGGNINIDSGSIRAYGGNIELAGLAAPGNVELNIAGDNLGLVIPENVERADVSLSNGAEINVRGAGGGNIKIQARNVNLAGQSILRAGIATGLGTPDSQGGDITINATGQTKLIDSSFIANVVQARAFGKAGDINIKSSSFALNNGAVLNASILGQGNGGNITINTNSLELTDTSQIQGITIGKGNSGNIVINARNNIFLDGTVSNLSAGISNAVAPTGEGNAGNIQITTGTLKATNGAFINSGTGGKGNGGDIYLKTGSLSLTNGSALLTSVLGQGNAGNITVEATDNVNLDGISSQGLSGLQSTLLTGGVGKAGNIQVTTGSLFVTNGAKISSNTDGVGNGGNITINARDNVTFSGFDSRTKIVSEASSFAFTNAIGNGGEIRITAANLLLKDGGQLATDTSKQGNGGNIFLDIGNTITLDGITNYGLPSLVTTTAKNGNGGNIQIATGSVFLTNGGTISSAHLEGKGNSGNISVNARDSVIIDGVLEDVTTIIGKRDIHSSLSSSLSGGEGKGGDIEITTGSLAVTNGGNISGNTEGQGNGGNITINARDTVTFDGGENRLLTKITTFAESNSTGNAGNIQINSKELFVKNDALLSAFSSGAGNGGDIEITTGSLAVTNGGNITGNTEGQGNGGNITINARDTVTFDGGENGLFTSANTSALTNSTGKAGDIEITTGSLTVTNGALISGGTDGRGNGGNITINARDTITLDGGENGLDTSVATTASSNSTGNAGNIHINAKELFVKNGSIFGAFSSGKGNAGDIEITTDSLYLSNGGQVGAFSIGKGNAGNIKLTSDSLYLSNGGRVSTSSQGQGKAGDINIDSGSTTLDNKSFINAITNSGDGGNINLTANDRLILRRGSEISTTAGTAQSGGDGGNININSRFIVVIPKENSDITANAFTGTGGNVEIYSQGIFGIESRPKLTEKSDITASSEQGVAGVININVPDTSSIQNSFTELSPVIDTNSLIANSCISRGTKRQENSFTITGSGALTTNRPGVAVSTYTTGEVRGVGTTSRSWKKGDPIIEPQAMYRLDNGQLLLSRECSE